MLKNSKIYLLSIILSSSVVSFSMYQPDLLQKSLKQFTRSLIMLSGALENAPRKRIEKKIAVELAEEERKIIQEFADKNGLSFTAALRQMVLIAASGVCPEINQPPFVGVPGEATPAVIPPPPPPPPVAPPAPPPATVFKGITKPSKQKTPQKPSKSEGLCVPTAEELKERIAGLKKIGDTAKQEKQSDELFLNAFRSARSIDEIIENLRVLKTDQNYLKNTNLVEPEKIALTQGGKIPTKLAVKKIQILELLKKKSKLILTVLTKEYLKDYLFNPDEFDESDFEHVRQLVADETEKRKSREIEQEEKKYIPWQEVLEKIIAEATSLDEVIDFIRAFPAKSKYLPNIAIRGKDKTMFVAIGSDDLKSIKLMKKSLRKKENQTFIASLKDFVTDPDLKNKIDLLFNAY